MSSFPGAEDLAEYIRRNYSGRVVEVGVGYLPDVAAILKAGGMDVQLTDKEARTLGHLAAEKDDIFSPRLDLYLGASLLYALRPPLELQIGMGEMAGRIGADVLVRPLGDEVATLPGFSRKLVNFGRARFFLFQLCR
ncbi:MAG: hypothetical protein EHM14_10440 [Methanothrix sp.]|nr:MAG: hypothetical protein EHM14_10440 [Methanothrix sp.]